MSLPENYDRIYWEIISFGLFELYEVIDELEEEFGIGTEF